MNCDKCDASQSTCEECTPENVLDNAGKCSLCGAEKFFKAKTATTKASCEACLDKNCKNCGSTEGSCTACVESTKTKLVDGKCECVGQFLDPAKNECVDCTQPECEKCSTSKSICEVCKKSTKTELKDTICEKCTDK